MSADFKAGAGSRTAGVRDGADIPTLAPGLWEELAGALAVGLAIYDTVGTLIWVNDALCRMLGFARGELIGSPMPLAFWPPEERATERAFFEAAQRGETSEREVALCRKDGQRLAAIVQAFRPPDAGGRTRCVVFAIGDVTQQKRATELQQREAQRWRAMAENPYDFVTIVDENYKYVYVNHTAPGIDKDELLGKGSPLDYLDQRDRTDMRDALARAFTGATTSCEVYCRPLDQWFSTIVTPIFTGDRVTAVSLLTRNIDQAKRAEQALCASEHRLKLALAGGDVGIFDFDVESGAVFCSPRLFEMFGSSPSSNPMRENPLQEFTERLHPDNAEAALATVRRSLSTGEQLDKTFRLRRRDETYGWFHVRSRSVEVNGTVHFCGFVTDDTAKKEGERERAELEARLRHVHKLDTLGRLAAGMAHDLNNLLVPILGNAQLLANKLGAESTWMPHVEDIVRAASRARDVVAKILLFGRPSEEPQKLVQVPAVVREALRFLQTSLPPNIELETAIDDRCRAVDGSPAELEQAVLNLLTNGVQALEPRGGSLRVTVEPFVVDESFARRHPMALGPAVRILVEDDGPGMTRETLDRAFEPFFTTKPVGKGSGLGLSIVHGIVSKHGGTVLAWSAANEGSRFEIYLPAQTSAAAVPADDTFATHARATGAKLRILCIDDEPAVLRIVTQILRGNGHEVTTSLSPREALQTFRAHPAAFDVVVTDQTMPDLTGIELASELYELRRDMPVVLISGYAESDALRSATPNVRMFVRKPFDARDLSASVERVTEAHGELTRLNGRSA